MDYIDITAAPYNAIGDGATDNTAGIQAALNAANTGPKILYVPPGNFCHGPLNATLLSGICVFGNGPSASILTQTATDAHGNVIDLTGSNGVRFKDLKLTTKPGFIPSTILFWAASASLVNGLVLENVLVDGCATIAPVFVFGCGATFTPSRAGEGNAAGGLICRDSVIRQRQNAPSFNTNPALRPSALRLDGINVYALQSAYAPVFSQGIGCNNCLFDNTAIIDSPPGLGNGKTSYNGALIAITTGTSVFNGGSIQALGQSAALFWANCEAVTFNGTYFQASDGSGNTVGHWLRFGGGTNGQFVLNAPFFSMPCNAFGLPGSFIGFDPPVSGAGGITKLVCLATDVGGNTNELWFIDNTFTMPGGSLIPWWLISCFVDVQPGCQGIRTAGSIDAGCIFRGYPVTSVPPGAGDASLKLN